MYRRLCSLALILCLSLPVHAQQNNPYPDYFVVVLLNNVSSAPVIATAIRTRLLQDPDAWIVSVFTGYSSQSVKTVTVMVYVATNNLGVSSPEREFNLVETVRGVLTANKATIRTIFGGRIER